MHTSILPFYNLTPFVVRGWHGAVDTPEGQDAIQRLLDKLKSCAPRNLMRSNKIKYKVLHLGQGNSQYQCRLGDEQIKKWEGDLGVSRRTWGAGG